MTNAMSKFQYVRVQYLQEEVFRTPADWDLKDITVEGGQMFYKSMLYTSLPKITIQSMEEVSDIMLEDDEGAIEQYEDAMPDEDESEEESEDESEEEDDYEGIARLLNLQKEREAMQKEREAMQKEDKN